MLTAKKHGHDPLKYYAHILKEIPHCKTFSDYEKLLPWNVQLHDSGETNSFFHHYIQNLRISTSPIIDRTFQTIQNFQEICEYKTIRRLSQSHTEKLCLN